MTKTKRQLESEPFESVEPEVCEGGESLDVRTEESRSKKDGRTWNRNAVQLMSLKLSLL